MNKITTGLVLMILWQSGYADQSPGLVKCDNVQGLPCKLVWNIANGPHAYYRVERFDTKNGNWIVVQPLPRKPRGVTVNAVSGGSLYRVVGCKPDRAAESCVGSSVHWVPFQAESAADLPDSVRSSTGDWELVVHKDAPLHMQNLDYNVGLLTQVLDRMGQTARPPMTVPEYLYSDQGPTAEMLPDITLDVWMQNELYRLYEGARRRR